MFHNMINVAIGVTQFRFYVATTVTEAVAELRSLACWPQNEWRIVNSI